MVCPFDRAQALELRQREQAIAAVLARKRQTGPSRTHCEDCDHEIPALCQAQGGITRCTPCQSIFEKRPHR